jgi:uncharacterized phage-associated protein
MAKINDVAAYMLEQAGPMTAMKLQKLCYYANGYHMAWEGRKLFEAPFEAWANGPVAPVLYALHRGRFSLSAGDITGDSSALDDGERESIDIVLANLGNRSAHELSQMTHKEQPWVAARARSGAGPLDRSGERLKDEEILEFFEALVANA